MKITFLGTGTPAPDVNRAGSSYLLTFADKTFLIDCGPCSFRRLVEKAIPVTDIDGIFLTHLHYDHCVDYASMVLVRWDQGAGKLSELDVVGPPGTIQFNESLVGTSGAFNPDLIARTQHPLSQQVYEERGGVLPRERPVPSVTEVEGGSVLERDGWKLTVAEVIHAQPYLTCLAYRIEAEGHTVVFGGDTGPTDKLIELSKGADVLVHMCHFINGDFHDKRITTTCSGHLDAAHSAHEAGVDTLALVHLVPSLNTDAAKKRMVEEISEIFSGRVVIGADLEEITI